MCSFFLANRGRFGQRMDWFTRAAEALKETTNEWLRAAVQVSLGIVYQEHPFGDRRMNLHHAIAACTQALRFYTPRTAPLDYATTQDNLGSAYGDLAGVEDRPENLRRAISAYDEALRFRTPEAAPLDCAGTQNNLGTTYGDLASVEDRAANLQRAIEAFSEALRFYTPKTAPLDYAGTQNNLG
ncbi:MAG TPA: hypothetical protein VMT34_16750, partial [Aggregatilineales bacterium]|nr:hypothetical protein [Aggregatilineales bacterium]